jgi:transcriptional regulator with AAA-type ATPase domain
MRNLELFKKLPDGALRELASHCRASGFECGTTILAQGVPPGDFYVLCEGSAEVVLDNKDKEKVSLAVLGPGEHFGEMSILTGELTSAAIIAAERCKVLAVAKEGFEKILDLLPELSHELVRTLSLRLKKVNLGVWEARNKEIALTLLMEEEKRGRYSEIVGKSKEIKKIKDSLLELSSSGKPLYLVGEKGAGKELTARSIHAAGRRGAKPFFAVDCGHLSGEDTDEKLFGRFGYLELADGGTLLLKYVDLLSQRTMKRLVDFLDHPMANIRVIATSWEDIRQKFPPEELDSYVVEKLFANPIFITPLRSRKRDIPELIQFYLQKYAQKYNRPVPGVSKAAMEKLLSYDYYHGNVAELEEVLGRAFLLTENDLIDSEQVFLGVVAGKTGPAINLLRFKTVMDAIQKKIYPRYFQNAVTAAFVGLILLCFLGPAGNNPGVTLAWSLGWPSFVFSAALFGRISCSVCPMSNIALTFQKYFKYTRPIPGFIKKYDYLIMTFLFVLIFWIEEITDMRHSPLATGLLFLAIVSGAVVFAAIFPRQTWCRHVCPLGGMFSVCSMTAPIELRSNVELCLNKCTTHNCYKGSEQDTGCPLFQHVPFIDNNQDCKLCLKCVRNCPNGSVQLNLRPPAREIWDVSRVRRSMVVFVAALLAIVFPLAVFDYLRESLSPLQWFLSFTFFYWLAALAAVGVTWLFVGTKFNEERFLTRIRGFYAFVPLVVGVYAAYQARFLPYVPELSLGLFQSLPGARNAEIIGAQVLSLLVLVFLLTGLFISLFCAWKITKTSSTSKYFLAKEGGAMVACALLVAFIFLWGLV